MPYNPFIHRRRSIRIPGHDYSTGSYFVTLVINQRLCVLGDVVDGAMILSDAGISVHSWWTKLPDKFQSLRLGTHVIMPNHLHGIIDLNRSAEGARCTLGQGLAWFKTMTTNEYIRGVNERDWQPFASHLWQRNYWEHIIRPGERAAIERYIRENPAHWDSDEDNPADR